MSAKKGLFYSMITILLVMPLVLIAISNINFNESEIEIAAAKVAGGKMVSFTESIDDDMPRALDIMAKRAITQAVVHLETNGTAFADSSAALEELISNGTLYGQLTDTNFTVTTWTFQLADKGRKYGLDTSVGVLDTRFYSLDSGHVGVELSILVNVSNSYANMSLYRVYNKTIAVQIEGFNDPVYTLNTNGILKRSIKFPNITVSGVQNFDSAVTYKFFMPSSDGASFLDRMEGRLRSSGKYNLTGAVTGLETVVSLPELQANGFTIKSGQSDMDYLYFDPAAYPGSPVVNSTHSWLRIDPAHAATYNITLG
jgi:hypothetical protein